MSAGRSVYRLRYGPMSSSIMRAPLSQAGQMFSSLPIFLQSARNPHRAISSSIPADTVGLFSTSIRVLSNWYKNPLIAKYPPSWLSLISTRVNGLACTRVWLVTAFRLAQLLPLLSQRSQRQYIEWSVVGASVRWGLFVGENITSR